MEIKIEFYETPSGHNPFDDWFESIRELRTRSKILTRLDRLKFGNFGVCGGDKGSQSRDVEKAKEYLKEYQSREKKYGKK